MGKTAGDYLCERLIEWGWARSMAFLEMGSTGSSARCAAIRTSCVSFRPVTRRWPRSWRAATG